MSAISLKSHFQDDWYKFTCDVMDEKFVETIIGNTVAPDNHAHHTTPESFVKACEGFMDENGAEFSKALDHLRTRRA